MTTAREGKYVQRVANIVGGPGAAFLDGIGMAGKSITRADRTKAVYKGAGLSCAASAGMVEQVTKGICNTLATGKTVKLSGFGVFTATDKGVRVGRSP